MSQTTVKSAVIVQPPPELWSQIQAIRSVHDKAFERWMPHINLLYPFVLEETFNQNFDVLQTAIKNLEPFTLTFDHMGHFAHGKSCTLFLEPTTKPFGALQTLQSTMENAFPFCSDLSTRSPNGFTPHLTLGQFTSEGQTQTKKAEFMKTFKPIEFTVNQVYMISRSGNDPFKIIKTVHLNRGAQFRTSDDSPLDVIQHNFGQLKIVEEDDPQAKEKAEKAAQQRFEEVCQTVQTWLSEMDPSKLPKTKPGLENALKSRCTVKYSVGTIEHAYQLLLDNGYVVETPKGLHHKKPVDHAARMQQQKLRRVPSDQLLVDIKIQEWVFQQTEKSLPKTKDKLMNCFVHLILVRDEIDPGRVVDHLFSAEVIQNGPRRGYDETLVYAL